MRPKSLSIIGKRNRQIITIKKYNNNKNNIKLVTNLRHKRTEKLTTTTSLLTTLIQKRKENHATKPITYFQKQRSNVHNTNATHKKTRRKRLNLPNTINSNKNNNFY